MFDTDYQLEYSESYPGTVHQEIAIEGYQYCTSLQRAFKSFISESYTNFILRVGCIIVATYCNVGFKRFDSHAIDLYCFCWMTISPFFALNCIFFLVNEQATLKTKQPVTFQGLFKVTNQIAGK